MTTQMWSEQGWHQWPRQWGKAHEASTLYKELQETEENWEQARMSFPAKSTQTGCLGMYPSFFSKVQSWWNIIIHNSLMNFPFNFWTINFWTITFTTTKLKVIIFACGKLLMNSCISYIFGSKTVTWPTVCRAHSIMVVRIAAGRRVTMQLFTLDPWSGKQEQEETGARY